MKEEHDYQTELIKYGAISFVPKGNSMWPFLKNMKQSVIVVSKKDKLEKYDVALYKRPDGHFVLHRVIKPIETGYIICGDSQFTLEQVEESCVFGVMIGFYRGKKYIDVKDQKYISAVEKWYANTGHRKRRLNRFFFRQRIKSIVNRILAGKKVEKSDV